MWLCHLCSNRVQYYERNIHIIIYSCFKLDSGSAAGALCLVWHKGNNPEVMSCSGTEESLFLYLEVRRKEDRHATLRQSDDCHCFTRLMSVAIIREKSTEAAGVGTVLNTCPEDTTRFSDMEREELNNMKSFPRGSVIRLALSLRYSGCLLNSWLFVESQNNINFYLKIDPAKTFTFTKLLQVTFNHTWYIEHFNFY